MNQPKFKFGDRVKASDGKVFIVSGIRRDVGCDYVYNEYRSSPYYAEFDLELYQEPKEEKLEYHHTLYGGLYNPRTRHWDWKLLYSSYSDSDIPGPNIIKGVPHVVE